MLFARIRPCGAAFTKGLPYGAQKGHLMTGSCSSIKSLGDKKNGESLKNGKGIRKFEF